MKRLLPRESSALSGKFRVICRSEMCDVCRMWLCSSTNPFNVVDYYVTL